MLKGVREAGERKKVMNIGLEALTRRMHLPVEDEEQR